MHSNETWQASQCLEQEEAAVGKIHTRLSELGYRTTKVISHTRSHWQRDQHCMVVSLVDDAWDCAEDRSQDTPYLFDANTTVITDNWINNPTVYKLAEMPDSFYGIYSYQPADQNWQPDRDYTFAVNRIDFKRMRILLNLYQHLNFDCGYVNFNCAQGRNTDSQHNFHALLTHASAEELPVFHTLTNMMPVKNYSIDHDQTYIRSWLNIIVETYSSDNVVALSEKIFRCLVTPVPWIAYSGRYTMARLRALGFDVLDDIVDHRYDRLIEAHHKIPTFVSTAIDTIKSLKQHDWETLRQRCHSAAAHNQQLLDKMKSAWPADFDAWLVNRIT
jgi:hypothetical protein